MQKLKLKLFALLFGLLIPSTWLDAYSTSTMDGYSRILIKEGVVQGAPKGSSIQASINGHTLTVVFTENLGQVTVDVTTVSGNPVTCMSTYTPNGVILYVTDTGDYIVTFKLSNGDEYYGEFSVTD